MCDPRAFSRRDFLVTGAGAAAAFSGMPGFRLSSLAELAGRSEQPFLEAALEAARWIETARVVTEAGVTWPADPNDPDSVGTTFYTHSPGVVVFLLELFHSTGDQRFLDEARRGADHLAAAIDGDMSVGLYTGLAGLAFVMAETHRASGSEEYRGHAERCTDLIVRQATGVGAGAAWPLPDGNGGTIDVNDIVSGTAGAGLGLLYLDRMFGSAAAVETAVQAGHRLAEVGIPADGGLKWKMSPTYERLMPNFSHGTAGVCFFLASLARYTGRQEFLTVALEGAAYLKTIATVEHDGYLIFHDEPLGKDLFYLGWCHGPVGTNRLFYELAQATNDSSWMEWVEMGARGIMNTGVPETRTAGFWNNVSQCGGSAGIGDFFLSLYGLTHKQEYLDFAHRLNDDLFQRVTRDAPGMKWIQSEHRVQPDLLVAQTGFMQGAAGIGTYLLYMDAMERGTRPAITLPDSPFGAM